MKIDGELLLGSKPDFLILVAQKAGTTSLLSKFITSVDWI